MYIVPAKAIRDYYEIKIESYHNFQAFHMDS